MRISEPCASIVVSHCFLFSFCVFRNDSLQIVCSNETREHFELMQAVYTTNNVARYEIVRQQTPAGKPIINIYNITYGIQVVR